MELKPVRDEWAGADTDIICVYSAVSNKILAPRSKSKYILDLRTPAIKYLCSENRKAIFLLLTKYLCLGVIIMFLADTGHYFLLLYFNISSQPLGMVTSH